MCIQFQYVNGDLLAKDERERISIGEGSLHSGIVLRVLDRVPDSQYCGVHPNVAVSDESDIGQGESISAPAKEQHQ